MRGPPTGHAHRGQRGKPATVRTGVASAVACRPVWAIASKSNSPVSRTRSTWTWRAAGAKLPRGTVDAGLVPAGTTVGTVLRAEVETTLDGTTVTALLAPKGKAAPKPVDRIEVLGTPQKGPDVNVVLAGKGKRRRDDDGDARRLAGVRPAGAPAREGRGRDGAGRRRHRWAAGRRPVAVTVRPCVTVRRGRRPPLRSGPSRWTRGRARPHRARRPAPARPRPSTATPPWPSSAPSSCPWPSSSSRGASPRCARPSRSRTPGPAPRAAPR